MVVTRRAVALATSGGINVDSVRRSTRVRKPTKFYEEDVSYNEDSSEDEEEAFPVRRSSRVVNRTNQYIDESEISSDESYESEEVYQSSDVEQQEEYQSDVEHQEEFVFTHIIASQTLTLAEWDGIMCSKNTSFIKNGSRWTNYAKEDQSLSEERFLVKWKNLSHLHCSWERRKDLTRWSPGAKQKIATFEKKNSGGFLYGIDERMDGDYFDPAWVSIDRILSYEKIEEDKGRLIFVKWSNKNYSECTWEYEQDLILNEVQYLDEITSFEIRKHKPSKEDVKMRLESGKVELSRLCNVFVAEKVSDEERDNIIKEYQLDLMSKEFKNGGKLRDYQAEGLSWLLSNHVKQVGSILADEMGLGKTLQTAAYINTVARQLPTHGPFLIIAPLSTIPHWQREFSTWTDLNIVVYHGGPQDRDQARFYEFAFQEDRIQSCSKLNRIQKQWRYNWEKSWMVEVVITTLEVLKADFKELVTIEWEILIVDEAHNLKNHKSRLAQNLRNVMFRHSLLLTGTPIQNNLEELWNLLNFINPRQFDSCEAFMEHYDSMMSKGCVGALHDAIRPYILRRLKEDVESSVPPREETLIEVELSTVQMQYYRALYEKNLNFLHKNKTDKQSLNNLAMQLRKCCNHPFMLNGVESDIQKQHPDKGELDLLIDSSGKLVLLEKLVPRLKEDGHRILLFSQFKLMLDIIQDYLNLRGFSYERIDGSIKGGKRQAAIDRFQSGEENGKEAPFIMLISTKAGGVGINLTRADTVIIFDSDWNPQNDLQAMARCHRIGQTKNVKIYRLLTSKTYEMQMFHMASLKMGLDQAVLQGIEHSEGRSALSKEEIEKLLKQGAYDIFKDDSLDKKCTEFISQDIDSILERRSTTITHDGSTSSGTFSKASFKHSNETVDTDLDDPDFWKKVVGEVAGEDDVNDNVLPPGERRKRTQTNYANMFEDFTDDSEEDNEDERENEESSVYNDDEAQIEEDADNDLEVLFEKVHISAPTLKVTQGAQVQQTPVLNPATFESMER